MCKLKAIINPCIITFILLSSSCFANAKSSAGCFNNDVYLLKMGVAGINKDRSGLSAAPAIGFAKRFEINDAAIEVSMNYAGAKNSDKSAKLWSFPKVSYLMFHDPESANSFYYGGGLSWSEINQKNKTNPIQNINFEGIFLEGTVGYEVHRDQKIRTTFELNLSQPLAASSRQGSKPGPSVFANIGFGFF